MTALLDTNGAAAYLGLHPITLAKMRTDGTNRGPKFAKLNSGKRAAVRYRTTDLDAWVEAQIVQPVAA